MVACVGINNEEGGGKPFVTVIQFLLEYLDKRPSEDLYSDEIQSECMDLFSKLVEEFSISMDSEYQPQFIIVIGFT